MPGSPGSPGHPTLQGACQRLPVGKATPQSVGLGEQRGLVGGQGGQAHRSVSPVWVNTRVCCLVREIKSSDGCRSVSPCQCSMFRFIKLRNRRCVNVLSGSRLQEARAGTRAGPGPLQGGVRALGGRRDDLRGAQRESLVAPAVWGGLWPWVPVTPVTAPAALAPFMMELAVFVSFCEKKGLLAWTQSQEPGHRR